MQCFNAKPEFLQPNHTCHNIVDSSRLLNLGHVSVATWRPPRTLRLSHHPHSLFRSYHRWHTRRLSRRGRGRRHGQGSTILLWALIPHTAWLPIPNTASFPQRTPPRLVRTTTYNTPQRRLRRRHFRLRDYDCNCLGDRLELD